MPALLATPEGLQALRSFSSAVARAVAALPTASPPRRKDGRVAVTIPMESVEHACAQLNGLRLDR